MYRNLSTQLCRVLDRRGFHMFAVNMMEQANRTMSEAQAEGIVTELRKLLATGESENPAETKQGPEAPQTGNVVEMPTAGEKLDETAGETKQAEEPAKEPESVHA